jgi:alpha-glucosidase (family GH31 glycosyl hydrolase)
MDRSLKGWKPLNGVMDTTGVNAEEYPFPVDQERISLLERFIKDCQQRNIRLTMIVSPMYICSKEDVFKIPRELAAKYDIQFIDHYRDTTFVGQAGLFYDFGHLNRKGAEIYSEIISKELKR